MENMTSLTSGMNNPLLQNPTNSFMQPSTLQSLQNVGFINGYISPIPCGPFDPTTMSLESKYPTDHLFAPVCPVPGMSMTNNNNIEKDHHQLLMGPSLGFQGLPPPADMHNYLTFIQQQRFSIQPFFNPGVVRTTDVNEANRYQYTGTIHDQLQRYPRLPLDAHRKIRQMGNEIIHYFETRLIHLESPSQVATFDSHVVFLKSPSTFQHWVMAFVKDQNRVLVKFNRLLTVHVKVHMQTPLTIEIEPSKLPNGRSDEKYIFNFENQKICAEFLRILNICKKEVWTRRGLDTIIPRPTRSVIPSSKYQGKGRERSALTQDSGAEYLESLNAFGDLELSPRKKFKGVGRTVINRSVQFPEKMVVAVVNNSEELTASSSAPPKFMRFPYRMKFILKNSAILSLLKDKKSQGKKKQYVNLGCGTLKIWGNDDCFDQLDFIGKKETICSHPIYSWNTLDLSIDEETNEFFCTWQAAADILNAPTSLPVVRNFKVLFPTAEIASNFKAAFDESCSKAARPEIIIKSHQNVPTVDSSQLTLLT